MVTTGDYLKSLRNQKRMSMSHVSELSYDLLDKTAISRIEKNVRNVSLRSAYAFAKIYQVSMEDIAEMALDLKIEGIAPPIRLSFEEHKIILKMRGLTVGRRKIVHEVINAISLLDIPEHNRCLRNDHTSAILVGAI